jgi:hypothetical protein
MGYFGPESGAYNPRVRKRAAIALAQPGVTLDEALLRANAYLTSRHDAFDDRVVTDMAGAESNLMLRGALHNRGSAGRCEACGAIFPCPTGLTIYEAVKRELEHPTPPPTPPAPPMATPAIAQPPVLYAPKWEDLPDRANRCPRCLHGWVSHGCEPGPDRCGMIESKHGRAHR